MNALLLCMGVHFPRRNSPQIQTKKTRPFWLRMDLESQQPCAYVANLSQTNPFPPALLILFCTSALFYCSEMKESGRVCFNGGGSEVKEKQVLHFKREFWSCCRVCMVLFALIRFSLVIKVKCFNKTHKEMKTKPSNCSAESYWIFWNVVSYQNFGLKASLGNVSVSRAKERTGHSVSFSKSVNRSANTEV